MNMTECVQVASSEHVAEIVGRQGSKIKALRAKTNTYIKTPVRGEEPVFVVTGRKEDVAAAKKEILSIAEHFSQIRAGRLSNSPGSRTTVTHLNSDIPGNVTIQVRVPYRVVGLVVGPKGATIKRIQQDSQTYIVTPSRDREPIFEVTGLSENVEKARCEIESYIALRTGNGISDVSLNSSNNVATMLRPYGSNCGMCLEADELTGGGGGQEMNAQLLLESVFNNKQSRGGGGSCNGMTSAALASSFNNTLNLSMAGGKGGCPPFLENGSSERCNRIYEGLLSASRKKDAELVPRQIYSSCAVPPMQNDENLYRSGVKAEAYDKVAASPFCNIGNLPSMDDIWSQMNGGGGGPEGTPSIFLDGLSSFFPPDDEFSAFQNDAYVGDCGLRSSSSLTTFPVPLGCFVNGNGGVDNRSLKEKNCHDALMVNGGHPPSTYVATVHSGSAGSASNSPSVSPTDSVGSPGQHRRRRCFICGEGSIVAALVPCGHNLFCMECAQSVLGRTHQSERRCPVCHQLSSLAVRILS